MPVVPFPTPNASASDLRRAHTVARTLALGVRFKGRPGDAARWALAASPADRDAALAADDTIALVKVRRALAKAHKAGDLDAVRQLRPQLGRLCARLTEVAQRHCVKGWHLALVVGLGLLAAQPMPARADDCASVRDHDRREACYGRTRSASDCEAVRNADERAACRAESTR